jgi:hypothetical protein
MPLQLGICEFNLDAEQAGHHYTYFSSDWTAQATSEQLSGLCIHYDSEFVPCNNLEQINRREMDELRRISMEVRSVDHQIGAKAASDACSMEQTCRKIRSLYLKTLHSDSYRTNHSNVEDQFPSDNVTRKRVGLQFVTFFVNQ